MKKSLMIATGFLFPVLFGATIELPPFGMVEVVDEIDCTKTDHDFDEYPAGASKIVEILGRKCRLMEPHKTDSSCFKYRIGKGKNLKVNGSYVLVMDYPDDIPREFCLINHSTDSRRSFATGRGLGDSWETKYANSQAESLAIPQSGKWELWKQYTTLCDRTADWLQTEVSRIDKSGNPVVNDKGEVEKTNKIIRPEDGFDFVICQYAAVNAPLNNGVAVSKILLCEIPDETKCFVELNLPPADLPRRHIFWREEMSDGYSIQGDEDQRMCKNEMDWFDHKARQMKMLGMNCYMKDLMEFGHVQHWDPNFIRPRWAWDGKEKWVWEKLVELMGGKYGFDLLPYYEWCGNRGAEFEGKPSYGNRKLAQTLSGKKDYTHVWWTEGANLDITDPEALKATCELMDGTILRFKDKANFVGALFRLRPAEWPVSFSDATRERYSDELLLSKPITRQELKNDKALYEKYLAWWRIKRAKFLEGIRAYLAEKGIGEAEVILDAEASEPGTGPSGGGTITDDPEGFAAALDRLGLKKPKFISLSEAEKKHLYLKRRNEACGTWGEWEWNHACPADCPKEFPKSKYVEMAMPVNRMFSVCDEEAFKAYSNSNGMTTVIRHYCLNENMLFKHVGDKEERMVGYPFAQDWERAGRACMQMEIESMFRGDIANYGYFMGSCYARGFPEPVREFNQNFLALPALPSKILKTASSDSEIIVREIDCSKSKHGKYFAIIHRGDTEKHDVMIKLPKSKKNSIVFLADGSKTELDDGVLKLALVKPWQLISIHR